MAHNFSEQILEEKEAVSPRDKINTILQEVEIDPDTVAEDIKHRLEIIDKHTLFIEDERRAINIAKKIFDCAESQGRPYTDDEKRIVKIGTIFTDVGKSGPRDATEEQSNLIARMYAKENIPAEDVKGSVRNFLNKYFSSHGKEMEIFTSMGLDPDKLTMRDFYNLHSTWTLEIITGDGIPEETVPAAACHHHLRGDNPGNILDSHDRYRKKFGKNFSYNKPEKLVNILDLYDAYRKRSGKSHEETIKILHEIIGTVQDSRYAHDPEFIEIIDDLEAAAADAE